MKTHKNKNSEIRVVPIRNDVEIEKLKIIQAQLRLCIKHIENVDEYIQLTIDF